MGRAGMLVRRMVALAIVVFAAGFGVFVSTAGETHVAPPAAADGIVVLTGGDHRLSEGMRLLGEGRARRLLISGVNRHTSREDLRKRSSLNNLLFDCCVDIGYEALDTAGNADEAQAWRKTWGFERIVLVTSRYHMPRSLMEFARAMPDAVFIPHTVGRGSGHDSFDAHGLRLLFSEYVKSVPSAVRYAFAKLVSPVLPAGSAPADASLRHRRPG